MRSPAGTEQPPGLGHQLREAELNSDEKQEEDLPAPVVVDDHDDPAAVVQLEFELPADAR